jgi:hypothetical protein
LSSQMENTIRLAHSNRRFNRGAICNFASQPKSVFGFAGKTKYLIATFKEEASKPRTDKTIDPSDKKPFRHGSG